MKLPTREIWRKAWMAARLQARPLGDHQIDYPAILASDCPPEDRDVFWQLAKMADRAVHTRGRGA